MTSIVVVTKDDNSCKLDQFEMTQINPIQIGLTLA